MEEYAWNWQQYTMAKNTGASRFRKVDVDQYDDDKYMDDTEVDSDLPDAQGANDAEVNNFLAQYPSFRVQSID